MTNPYIDTCAGIITCSLLAIFYIAYPDYLKEPLWIRQKVKRKAKQAIKEELLRYTKKHLD